MLSRREVKEITAMEARNGYLVSLYMNVDPTLNTKGDYQVHFKNMMKNVSETLDKAIHKAVKGDLERIENYVLANKRMFKKGLVLFSSTANSLWKEYHLGVPVKNELIVDKTLYTKPLLDILDNYQRYLVLLVDKESARIFVVHLGEIVEYGEVQSVDVPGKHKKGGWFALSQNHYERHIDFHVGLHLKDVVAKLESFMSGEYIGRVIIGGAEEAVSMVKGMLHKTVLDKIIGAVRIEMFSKPDEILQKVAPVVSEHERKEEEATIERLITKAMKNEGAVLGIDNVINAVQEQRVMKLILLKNYKSKGYGCAACAFLTSQPVDACPYCKRPAERIDYVVDMAAQKAVQQGALVEVVEENKKLEDAGGIGALLRF